MTVNLHVRDVPESIHETLTRRAAGKGMSLRRYTIEVLAEHCALPTLDDWLDEVRRLEPLETRSSGADAVTDSRADDDRAVLRGHSGG